MLKRQKYVYQKPQRHMRGGQAKTNLTVFARELYIAVYSGNGNAINPHSDLGKDSI